jgi:hypothetical protein
MRPSRASVSGTRITQAMTQRIRFMPNGGNTSESTRPNAKLPAQNRAARTRKTYGGILSLTRPFPPAQTATERRCKNRPFSAAQRIIAALMDVYWPRLALAEPKVRGEERESIGREMHIRMKESSATYRARPTSSTPSNGWMPSPMRRKVLKKTPTDQNAGRSDYCFAESGEPLKEACL